VFLNHKSDGKMVEVLSLSDLFNPNHHEIVGRFQAGEELQDPEKFSKTELEFLSGEALPKCWLDVHYRDNELHR
jgi:hypothetical protein